ncbi:hypothetical protein [Pseudodesulfovibrio sp.]|uniref:hypothetical protein n=1 Tax=unclassified Pseudodesulfovibrio TaxID=2661612 RepID=UPI003B001196
MNRTIGEVEESIHRMTASLRQGQADEIARSFGENPDPEVKPLGWWVLARGEDVKDASFAEREAARERLLVQVRAAGLVLPENIWVLDETETAQLVVTTVPTLNRAEKLAEHLRTKGLDIRIRREKI